MRPRLLHLGSFVDGAVLAENHHMCFNEAEAFTPRIRLEQFYAVIIVLNSFNEAEAFTPRILTSQI